MKPVIVNLVNDKPSYLAAQQRLLQSLSNYNNESFDVLSFIGENQVGSPSHSDNPYAFKIYSIDRARAMGYTKILWIDSSFVAVKNLDSIWDRLDQIGYAFQLDGNLVGHWSNDRTLNYFGITREHALTMPMYSAGMTGLNFESDIAVEFYSRWKKSMLDGQFIGSWSDHRHDMTCANIIANDMGLNSKFAHPGDFFSYVGPGYAAPHEKSVFHLLGV